MPLSKIVIKKDEPKCKGLFFRGRVSTYFDYDKKEFRQYRRLTLMKRKSCKGCEKCGWFWDYISEEIINANQEYLADIEEGKLYTIETKWCPGPYEYPQDGDLEVEFVEVKENDKKD